MFDLWLLFLLCAHFATVLYNFRYSPQLEDDRAHELSTITEVDTPATSRINATITHNETATLNKTKTLGSNVVELFYNRFPAFSEYARAHNLDLSVDSSGSMLNITAAVNVLLGDKGFDVDGSQVDAMKYRSFHESLKSLSSTTNMEYMKFPPHTDYARNVPGLLDSRSLEGFLSMEVDAPVNLSRPQNTEERNDSSLIDVIGELQKRNLMKEALALAALNPKNSSETNSSSTSVDALEKELERMGINWASSMLKKSKETNALSSTSSSKSSTHEISAGNRRRSIKPVSPSKSKTGDNSKATVSNSFLDPELTAIERETQQPNTSKEQSLNATETKPVNLKQFLARELMKHSSTSSSSSSIDSSLASIYLKSFIGTPSNPSTPLTGTRPQSHEKQRTSTPVNVSGSGGTRGPSADQKNGSTDLQENFESGNLTDRLFSGESRLSSVRSHNSDTDITFGSKERSIDEEQRHKQFEAIAIPASLHLNLAASSQKPGSTNSS